MRLYPINPSNPLVSIVEVKERCWNRYRMRRALNIVIPEGLTLPE